MIHLMSLVEWLREPRPRSYWVITLMFWAMIIGPITAGVVFLLHGDAASGVGFILFPLYVYALMRMRENNEKED